MSIFIAKLIVRLEYLNGQNIFILPAMVSVEGSRGFGYQ